MSILSKQMAGFLPFSDSAPAVMTLLFGLLSVVSTEPASLVTLFWDVGGKWLGSSPQPKRLCFSFFFNGQLELVDNANLLLVHLPFWSSIFFGPADCDEGGSSCCTPSPIALFLVYYEVPLTIPSNPPQLLCAYSLFAHVSTSLIPSKTLFFPLLFPRSPGFTTPKAP
ncbi:hypothetical protein TNIN_390981 [Trichonephila inaurata madagascariensis]|uniref:Uncharacterized protein n=1 Tax=Trichonephila inaurata madagascariensis TaxID=2747483 RepID=A0A8X6XSL1_9ARAC|nr:hypothetical protein TNIN_390981 [Trichonephila inaurata madagascariensis]